MHFTMHFILLLFFFFLTLVAITSSVVGALPSPTTTTPTPFDFKNNQETGSLITTTSEDTAVGGILTLSPELINRIYNFLPEAPPLEFEELMDSLYNFKDETESDTRTNFRQTHPYFESATWLTYIKEYDFALVCEAAARDDFQLVEDILEALIYKEYHSTLSQLIEADHYSVFISVFKNSRVDLLQKLWSLTTLESQRLEMLEAVFGRIAILDFTGLKCIHNLQQVWAWAKDLNQHQILLETYGYTALESVPGNVASMIWNWAEEVEDLQREWLNRNAFDLFVNHATSHHGDFFELLWEFGKITQQQQEMLRASDYMAFRYAALRGDLYILTRLWTWATELGVSKDMITSSDYGAFRNSVTNNSMDVAAKLYVYAGPLNLQEELMGMLTENQRQSLLRRVDNNFNFL